MNSVAINITPSVTPRTNIHETKKNPRPSVEKIYEKLSIWLKEICKAITVFISDSHALKRQICTTSRHGSKQKKINNKKYFA